MVKNLFRVVFMVVFGAMSADYDVIEGMNNQHADGFDQQNFQIRLKGCFYFHTENTNENILESTAVIAPNEAWMRLSSPLLRPTLIRQIASGVQIQNLHGSRFAWGDFVLYFQSNDDAPFNEARTNDIIDKIVASLDSQENGAYGAVDLNCFRTDIIRDHISESLRVWPYLTADTVFLFVPVALTEYGTRRRDNALRAQQSQNPDYVMRLQYFPANESETDTGQSGFQIPQNPPHGHHSNPPAFDPFAGSRFRMTRPAPEPQAIIEPSHAYYGLRRGTTDDLSGAVNNNRGFGPPAEDQIMITPLPDAPYPQQMAYIQPPVRVNHPKPYSYINFLTYSATDTVEGASNLLSCLCGMINQNNRLKSYFDARTDLQVQLISLGIADQISSATQILRRIQAHVRNQSNETQDNFFFFYVEFPNLNDMNTLNVCDALRREISVFRLEPLTPLALLSDRDVRTHVYNATIAQKNGAADHGIQIRGCFILLPASPTASGDAIRQTLGQALQIAENLRARH